MCELAGIVGVDPGKFTLRELVWMSESRLEAEDRRGWKRTFAIMATLYNANRGENTPAIDPMEFYPYEKGSSEGNDESAPVDRELMRRMFPGNRKRGRVGPKK
jgi:hypothetical protein